MSTCRDNGDHSAVRAAAAMTAGLGGLAVIRFVLPATTPRIRARGPTRAVSPHWRRSVSGEVISGSMEGRYDHECPSEIAERYFGVLRAPVKKLIWFDRSAHLPNAEERDLFNKIMVEEIRMSTELEN